MEPPVITVNGAPLPLAGTPPHTTALTWLRARGLTGAKEGCNEGECGACSILVARPGTETPTEWTALNACLLPAAALAGQEVVTVEGLGDPADLHPVQRELAERGGSQCGYCTPGFVCSMAAEYYRPGREPREAGPEHGANGFDLHALSGNLCRCTGYRPIRDAAYALGAVAQDDALAARRDRPAPASAAVHLGVEGAAFVRPAGLDEALRLLAEHPDATVVAGSTDWGVEVNLRGARTPLTLAVDRLPELRELRFEEGYVEVGAALSLTEVERRLAGRVPILADLFPQFASRLIRNGATLGGNLATASPIGDAPPALLALDASVVLTSPDGDREVPMAELFTGYRETVRHHEELIRSVRIPLPLAGIQAFHKVAKRRFDDISSVAVGFALDVSDGVVQRARIGLGGVAATPVRALRTEQALTGAPWTEETVRAAADVLGTEGTPMDDHRASAAYRSAMLRQSLLKLWATRADQAEVVA
ncbi:xanthine dehydrogenase small subunit [Nocardioides sp. MAHUQ-72]|uniref:xanthine dehydrogenase small subunit n=1 Tax=unclassified Nocardioides TaxID=2615069 RepID=UPI00360F826A